MQIDTSGLRDKGMKRSASGSGGQRTRLHEVDVRFDSGVARNLHWGPKSCLPSPFPSSPPSLFPLPSFPLPFLPSPLEVGPLNPARGLRERCKLPSGVPGLGQSPSRNRIWCILALKSDIWCHNDRPVKLVKLQVLAKM